MPGRRGDVFGPRPVRKFGVLGSSSATAIRTPAARRNTAAVTPRDRPTQTVRLLGKFIVTDPERSPELSLRVVSGRSGLGAAAVARHRRRLCPFRLRPGPMARRRGGSRGDLSRHELGGGCGGSRGDLSRHGVGGGCGGFAGEGGHVGRLVGGKRRRKRCLMRFAREAYGCEESSGEKEVSARH